jgi:hypothetical protein
MWWWNYKIISLHCLSKLIYCHVSGVCVTNKTDFWILCSNLLDLYTTGYNSSQITHCHLLPTGHSTGTPLTSNWTPPLLRFIPLYSLNSDLPLFCSIYNSSARTPRKTLSSFVKNACFLARYLSLDVLLLLTAYALSVCLPNRCLAMGICVTICWRRSLKWWWTYQKTKQMLLFCAIWLHVFW